MKQKHFMDIRHAVLEPTEFFAPNTGSFHVGDEVVIQEKVDGANGCVRYDAETGKLVCFSRNNELSYNNTLRGFWNLVQKLDAAEFAKHPNWYVFGEFLVPHTIKYDDDQYNKWYVYDIFDADTEKWLTQDIVKQFCENAGLEYVHTFYVGKFISFEHVKFFMNCPGYGKQQEGVIVKNQTTLNENYPDPPYLKFVSEKLKEIKAQNHRKKVEDPQKKNEWERAAAIVDTIVTKPRVIKILLALVDEEQLPRAMQAEDMKLVAKVLPKRVYEDCVKEHKDLVAEAGEPFGKMCSAKTMQYARKIILGGKTHEN